jgi:hypothetical protein
MISRLETMNILMVLNITLVMVIASVHSAAAQPGALGKILMNPSQNRNADESAGQDPTYITGPKGKSVRTVGPRFLPDPQKRLSFPGRPAVHVQ